MKFKYFSIFVAAIISLMTVNSCTGKLPVFTDPVITLDTDIFQAGPQLQAIKVEVSANCSWVVLKEDYEGNAQAWIQTDMQKGDGNATLGIRVLENRDTEKRVGQVVVMADGAKAFIDVIQAGADPRPEPEPEPVPPGPEPEPGEITLSFDFTVSGLNWPKDKTTPWSNFTNMDSGLALDNGGTATENPHRRVQCGYVVDGVEYLFTLADADKVIAHNIYLSEGKGVYSGTYRYFGLPAIEGKKLTKVVMVQGASTKDPAAFNRGVGITENVYEYVTLADVANIVYIAGGEPQNQYTNMETYTYELIGTEANKVYYLASPYNASIIVSMTLTYETSDTPGPGPGPGPEPEPENLDLLFSFEGEPQAGWPTAVAWAEGKGQQMTCTYSMVNGKSYDLTLIEPGFAEGGKIYWNVDKSALFMGKYRYLAFPVVSGYVLQTVECKVAVQIAGSAMAIMDHVYSPATQADPDSYAAPAQAWNVAPGTIMTYVVNATNPDQQYYLYCKNPSGGEYVGEMTLKYTKK